MNKEEYILKIKLELLFNNSLDNYDWIAIDQDNSLHAYIIKPYVSGIEWQYKNSSNNDVFLNSDEVLLHKNLDELSEKLIIDFDWKESLLSIEELSK